MVNPSGGRKDTAVTAFLRDAFIDYLAARVLLLADLPEVGAVLCSTAIEKCAKAIITKRGEEPEKHHLGTKHWRILEREENIGHRLNEKFIELSQRAYRLRYTRDLPENYNLVVASREFLAEMDQTLQTILSCFQCHVNGARRLTGYEGAVSRSDERLVAENHILSGESVADFILCKPQSVYEVRRHAHGVIEARYLTVKSSKRPGFLRAALRPGPNVLDFDLSHFPNSGSFSLVVDGIERIGREGNLVAS